MDEMMKDKLSEEMKKMGISEDMIDDELTDHMEVVMDDLHDAVDMMKSRGLDEMQAKDAMKKTASMMIDQKMPTETESDEAEEGEETDDDDNKEEE